jgi:hypothetical protein
MSRSGYSDDYDKQWRFIMWRGAVASAINGKRGQAFLPEMIAALDGLPEKRLIPHDLIKRGADADNVCAIGSVGLLRGVDMNALDPENYDAIAATFKVAPALVQESEYINDEANYWPETPEARWKRMRDWAEQHLVKAPSDAALAGFSVTQRPAGGRFDG